jgi:hypothetical protein
MAILAHVDLAEFTHKGWIAFCPVYIANIDSDGPIVCERNWVPEFVLTMANWAQMSAMWLLSSISHDYEPLFAIKVTGELRAKAGE